MTSPLGEEREEHAVRWLTDIVLRHRILIAIFWIVSLGAGIGTASQTVDRLTSDFSLPGQPGDITNNQLLFVYGNGGHTAPLIPTVTAPEGATVDQLRTEVDGVFSAIRTRFPDARVLDFASTGDRGFVTNDGRTAFAFVQTPPPEGFAPGPIFAQLPEFLKEEAKRTGLTIELTGYDTLAVGGEAEGPSVLIETLVAAAGALVVLLFVFASFLAFVPLLVAAVSILSTFLMLLGLTYLTDMNFVVQFLISLIGLGVAIDYSLLLVTRWREERAKGADNETAVRESMRTAGHAVIASAITVAISLLALVVLPVPFLRSMGFGGMLIPLVSAAVVLTLLPVLLSAIGPAVDWPRLRHEQNASRPWTAWARNVIKFRWVATIAAVLILGVLAAPVLDMKVGLSRSESLATNGPAFDALKRLKDGGVTTGYLTPLEVLVQADDDEAARVAAVEIARQTREIDGVQTAIAPAAELRSGYTIVEVVPERETVDVGEAKLVNRIREQVGDVPGFSGIAGTGAVMLDYREGIYTPFPWVLALIALVTFLLLVRTFRSVLLPIKAIILNLASMAATFGAVVYFWQQGHGSEALFNVAGTGAITFWLPVVIFSFLFGLSMDYEVFILARMREEYDTSGSTSESVAVGLGRTGRLVTSAALILFLSFIALSSAPGTDIKVLGTALGFGILLDATVVRALLVPALVSLFGKYNWWLPGWLAKLLWVEPSPLRSESAPRAPQPVAN